MTMRWLCLLWLGLAAQLTFAQESLPESSQMSNQGWPLDAQIAAAARALLPPASNQRRNIVRHSRYSPALQELLSQNSGSAERDALPVRIHIASSRMGPAKVAVERISASITRLGGEVDTALGDAIYASLSADALAKLAATKDIRLIEPQASFGAQAMLDAARPESESAQVRMLASLATLHDQGMRGKGVRVGVLDFSFAGYAALLAAKQLPPVFAQRAFAGKQATAEDGKNILGHGTECARIIHALAPDAELVIASVGDGRDTTEGRVLAAAQWLVAQGASIINFSGSGYVSPLDGSAPLDQLIDQLTRQGSTWIVAAGNQAQLHWQGSIADDNRNGWIDPAPSPVSGDASRQYGDLFMVEVARAGPVTLTLNWGPWNGQPSDLDIFLYRAAADGKLVQIAQSDTVQEAEKAGNARPLEVIQTVLESGYYFIGVRATRLIGKGTAHLFVSGAKRMTPVVEAGSVGSPGTAKMAVTVGAANAKSMLIERYSGRGPTEDGRRKPELLANGEVFKADGATGFRGTSAAAPMVSGLAALMAPASGPALRERLQQLARQSPGDAMSQASAWGSLAPELLLTRR